MSARLAILSALVASAVALLGAAPAPASAHPSPPLFDNANARPFTHGLELPRDFDLPIGPGNGGTLAISSIVVTNRMSTVQEILLVQDGLAVPGANCAGAVTGHGWGTYVRVQPNATLQLTFPVPWVLSPIGGNSCFSAVGIDPNAAFDVFVTGAVGR